jgi:hypothetical protein
MSRLLSLYCKSGDGPPFGSVAIRSTTIAKPLQIGGTWASQKDCGDLLSPARLPVFANPGTARTVPHRRRM